MSGQCFRLQGLGMTFQTPFDLREPNESENSYSLIEVDSHLEMFKEISIDFKNVGLKVIKIEQLSNHLLWQKYMSEKMCMQTRKPQDPAFEMNEKYLYHGTTAKKEYICEEGLDARLSKRGLRFGQGIYFSDNPLKCIKYAEKGKDETSFIVMARVILGDSKIYSDGVKDRLLTREPEKKSPYKGWRFYDSVVGRPKDFKEFVIYRNERALIECVVTYCKDTNSTASLIPRVSSVAASSYGSKSLAPKEMKSNSLPFPRLPSSKKNDAADRDYDDDSETSDEDEKAESSDSGDDEVKEDEDDYSSDSSVETNNDSQVQFTSYSSKTSMNHSTRHTNEQKKGEDILADKKKEFALHTGETRQCVIESYLSLTGLNVDKAVNLFLDKEKKREKMEREEKMQQMTQEEEDLNKETDVYEDAASGVANLSIDAEELVNMRTEDREAIIDSLIENFLTVVGLDDNLDNRKLSRKILFLCNCDLDSSIVAYYESL